MSTGDTTELRLSEYLTRWPKRGKTVDNVASVLREAILDGVLQPSKWLREMEVSQELSVSRTPVREALRRLASEGLVVIVANQGAMVAPMTIDDVLEMYAVRENLEGLAAKLAAKNRSQKHLRQLEEISQQMRRAVKENDGASELIHLNLSFHRAIRDAAGNHLLHRFLEQVEYGVRRFGSTTLQLPGRAEEALGEHDDIVEAIVNKDTGGAEKSALHHMRQARESRIKMLIDP